ncbi:MAG: hypothetical protein QNJ19_14310 [Woeseiaceae bacterium]|nr:hypothetical protein [Woeseiaceae bacterium]
MRTAVFATALLVASGCVSTPGDALICRSNGMAGVQYGQTIESTTAKVDEITSVGVRYYTMEPALDIAPFERLVVGATPASGQVFSIRLEKHGNAADLDRDIAMVKARLEDAYPTMAWQVIGNHHHAKGMPDLDLTVYRIGELKGGRPSFLLSYDCDNKRYRQVVIDEARTVGEQQ